MTENIHFKIAGSYQYDAYHNGICFQRSWHQLKFQKAIELMNVQGADVVLDAACGSGVLSHLLAEQSAAKITGVDFNEAAIGFCKSKYTNSNLQFFTTDLLQRRFEENSFTKISMLETIEHLTIDRAKVILQNLYYYLKPGGKLVLSTPNKNSLWPAIEFMLDTLKLTPKMKDEQHVNLYTKTSLRNFLEEAGFKVTRMETTHFIAPWLSFLGLNFSKKVHLAEQRIKIKAGSLLFVAAVK